VAGVGSAVWTVTALDEDSTPPTSWRPPAFFSSSIPVFTISELFFAIVLPTEVA
jgi:hypothetical protein